MCPEWLPTCVFLADDFQVTFTSQHRAAHGVQSSSGAQGLTLPMLCTVYSVLEAFQYLLLALLSLSVSCTFCVGN
jgi:hypothetical protein